MKPFPRVLLLAAIGSLGLVGPRSALAATNFVAFGDYYFKPSVLTIHVGDTVVWTNVNTGLLIHTVTGLSPGERLCGSNNVNACTNTFNVPGDFLYECIHHYFLGMTGAVQVLPLPTSAVLTNAARLTNGDFEFTTLTAPNQTNIVQGTTNIAAASDWVSLDTNVPATNSFRFTDTNAEKFPFRFYRVVNP